MKEWFKKKQAYLLLMLGLGVGYAGWHLTENLAVAAGCTVLAYFLIMLKEAATWPVIFLLLSTAGLTGTVAYTEFGWREWKKLGPAAGAGFVAACLLVGILYSIRKKGGKGRDGQGSGQDSEGMSVQTEVYGRSLIAEALAGGTFNDFLAIMDGGETEGIRQMMLNPHGVATSNQERRAVVAAEGGGRPRRRKFRLGKGSIPHS